MSFFGLQLSGFIHLCQVQIAGLYWVKFSDIFAAYYSLLLLELQIIEYFQ